MTDVRLTWHQFASHDPELAAHLEEEVRAAAALAPEVAGGLVCRILVSRPKTLSLQLNLPGWTKVLSVPLPPAPGAVRYAVSTALAARLNAPAASLERVGNARAEGLVDATAALLET
jgi:hypothetical protein